MKKSTKVTIVMFIILFFIFWGVFMISKKYIKNIKDTEENNLLLRDYSEKENDEVINYSQENGDLSVQAAVEVANTQKWDLTKVDIVYDTDNIPVPVPKGYVASDVDGEHTVSTGFVIYDGDTKVTNDNAWEESCKRNQWVWVPVADMNRIFVADTNGKTRTKLYNYTTKGRTSFFNNDYEPGVLSINYDTEVMFESSNMNGMTKQRLLQEMQKQLEDTMESIKKYGGFWIGRYETGNLNQKVPVLQRMQKSASASWYIAYTNMQRIDVKENVRTSMIYGGLWDETLQWLIDSGNKTNDSIVNSTSWGNYTYSSFEYKNDDGEIVTKTSGTSGSDVKTGSTEYTNANNIYDLAGGNAEWTLEANGTYYRVVRGDSSGAAGRNKILPINTINARAYLYIK